MALIDITELLFDPDFVDKMTLILRYSAVSSRGENMIKEVATDSIGSIQPVTGKDINRLPQALQSEEVSTFFFQGTLPTTDKCDYPSILVFNGKRYQVRHVFDWSNWGAGWVEGLCVSEKLA